MNEMENILAAQESESTEPLKKQSQAREVWRRFCRNKLAMIGLFIVVILILVAIFAEFVSPYAPDAADIANRLSFPSREHLLGTDNFGRDLLTRIIYGTRISLIISVLSLIIGLVIGGILGAVAGYFGGGIDNVIMRLMDVLMSIPGMLMAVCISALLGSGVVNTAIAISFGGIAPSARLLRSTFLTVRGQEFVEAARATGSSHMRIIVRQILPNTLSPIIVDSTLRVGMNILQISMLSFIGLGVQPPTAEWGSIMNAGREFIASFYPMLTFPGVAILLSMFGFNVMGDGLRDALDPKLKN